MSAKDRIQRLVDSADVRLDGGRAWDIQVHDDSLLSSRAGPWLAGPGRKLHGRQLGRGRTRLDDVPPAGGAARPACSHAGRLLVALRSRFFNLRSGGPSRSASTTTTSATTCSARCSTSAMIYSCGYWQEAARPGRSAGGQARPGLPQAGAGARHAAARHRLRLGRALSSPPSATASRSSASPSRSSRCRSAASCARAAGRDPAAGLPRAAGDFRPRALHRHVRARRRSRTTALLRTRPRLPGGRRPVPAAHDRQR